MNNVCTSQETCYVSATQPKRLMRSIGLWRWYINITITTLDIIHRPVFYLEQWFGHCILSPFSGGTYSFGLHIFGPNSKYQLKAETESCPAKHCVLNRRKTMDNILNCDSLINNYWCPISRYDTIYIYIYIYINSIWGKIYRFVRWGVW
jgi:hypothetical protein